MSTLYIRKAKAVLHDQFTLNKQILIQLSHKAANIFPCNLCANFPTLESISFKTLQRQKKGIFLNHQGTTGIRTYNFLHLGPDLSLISRLLLPRDQLLTTTQWCHSDICIKAFFQIQMQLQRASDQSLQCSPSLENQRLPYCCQTSKSIKAKKVRRDSPNQFHFHLNTLR